MSIESYDDYLELKNLRAKINDMLARIASLEDKVRELQFLHDESRPQMTDSYVEPEV